jgi:ABC-2 type transport system permease protein
MFLLLSYLLRKWRERRDRILVMTAGAGAAETSPATAGRASARAPVVDPEVARPSAAARGPAALLLHQVRYDLLTSLRNPRARFFTFFFPIVLLVVFTGVFGSGHTVVDGVRVDLSRFYVPGILAMSIVVAAYANLVISITSLRETGVLKRRRATPVSPCMLVAGQAIARSWSHW